MDRGVKTVVNLEMFSDDKGAFAQARTAPGGSFEAGYFRMREEARLVCEQGACRVADP